LFVIFGVTGDLSKKKLIPALYHLLSTGKAPHFAVVGNGRKELKAEDLLEGSRQHVRDLDETIWKRLKSRFYYHKGDFYDRASLKGLRDVIAGVEKKHALAGNRLFYLAVMPGHFEAVASNLKKYRLVDETRGWMRLVFEKPFGHDLKSARKMNKCIKKVFSEEQIFRLDHYLGKELVQSISLLRFANAILEPLWNGKFIDHVQIILSESIGVEERGATYDATGALKDVVQNHMMQILALVAMEAPAALAGESIRSEKAKVLEKVDVDDVVFARYDRYRDEPAVRKDSQTETLAALKLYVKNKRWNGVPFYLLTGKKMQRKLSSIYIQFKEPPCRIFDEACIVTPNYLVIQIQPNEGFYLRINAKAPGTQEIRPVTMDFCHECAFGPNTPEAYENLLLNVLDGDQSVFVRSDEIENAWSIIDTAQKKKPQVYPYKEGMLPEQAGQLIEKGKRRWHLKISHEAAEAKNCENQR